MVSAARKQQNIKAQQRFRAKGERQKRRVEELEKTVENLVPLPSNSSEEGQYQRSSDPRDFLVGSGFALDDTALEKIAAGQVAMEDILRAGLRAYGLLPSSSTITTEEPQGTSTHDRILVPQNGMHAHPHSLPDVYFNQLRVKQVDTVAAFRSNAELLGISFETLINPHAQSPFCSAEQGQDAPSYERIPADLRPTPAQLQHPHPAYIDAFPFAALREQLILMMKTVPAVVDEDDFCQDLEKGGLICWGSTVDSQKGFGAGAPWDSRSWEAQPWLLKKWWILLGGAEGALFKQTQWWHQFRGDRLPDLW